LRNLLDKAPQRDTLHIQEGRVEMSEENEAEKSETNAVKSAEKFDLNMHTARLLMNEPFFAALSRRIDKVSTRSIPTAGVTIDKKTAQFKLYYNPDFMNSLPEREKLGVLKHEFYHIIFEHVTGRRPSGKMTKKDNICMDLAINSHLIGELPDFCCMPGGKNFEWAEHGKTYEWYLANWQDPEEEEGEGESGEGSPSDSFDDHSQWADGADGDNTVNEIAKERLKEALKKAAEEAAQAGSWGSVSSSTRKDIMERMKVRVNWEKALRYFVKTSQRANKKSTVRRINSRFPYIHAGKKITRTANIAIAVDQSGSVSDAMLVKIFAAMDKLSKIATFTIVPFDTEVALDHVKVWKKGQRFKAERVSCGGTDFQAPTDYVNKHNFDGLVIATDMEAPKPGPCKVRRIWLTTKEYADRPYFTTSEIVLVVD
jgi:predicted metal-dependent peptidase